MLRPVSRDVVYWFGPEPDDGERLEFERRNLTLKVFEDGTPDFTVARAAVFCGKPPKLPQVCRQLANVETALQHGLLVYVLAQDEAAQDHMGNQLTKEVLRDSLKDRLRRRTGRTEPYECAELIARYQAGPSANSKLEISIPADMKLPDEHRFFMSRAFSDCKTIALKHLPGGRTANVYLVQATLMFSEAGPRPLPFFAKLGSPKKIAEEKQCYDLYASMHIPWTLRPNLEPSRSMVGVSHGILVGSFVDQSESLWDAAQSGKGARCIHALFEDTLAGWRSQAYRENPRTGSLASALSDVFIFSRVKPEYVALAQSWGTTPQPKELWEALLNVKDQRWRMAPMHGDMHGENVRVRNNDAIIIDLANVTTGPLCADLASLDVWLSFEVPRNTEAIPDRAVWAGVVNELYSPENAAKIPSQEHVDVGIDWLRGSIRQIRMISASICECPSEYPTALALHLLRRACYDPDPPHEDEDHHRRAYAYWLGAGLVAQLTQNAGSRA